MTAAEILFLDSASVSDAEEAASLGFIAGITTNPTLLVREGQPARRQIEALLGAFPGLVFYQPVSTDERTAREEIKDVGARADGRVVAKLPALPHLIPLAASLHRDGVPCALTAVYSGGQALLAAAAGAGWIIPYVNRAKRLMEGGDSLVQDLASVLLKFDQRPAILAASIKSPEEAIGSVRSGADAISASLDVIRALAEHPLTVSAVDGFRKDAEDFPSD